MTILRPAETASSIFEIDFPRLYGMGKRALIFDLDNTLGKRGLAELKPEVSALLTKVRDAGFKIGILTNRRRLNGNPMLASLSASVPLLSRARKPLRSGFNTLLEMLDSSPSEAVMIGDRLLTDVVGANRLGIYSIRILRAQSVCERR